jgi:hypothetical protein
MGKHPLNNALRFLLEMLALISFGYWGYLQTDLWWRILLAAGLPLLFASIWGIFAVPGDPSRSGLTIVKTPGFVRLIIELGLFAAASWMLLDLTLIKTGWIFAGVTLLHYVLSYDRILWLLKQQ